MVEKGRHLTVHHFQRQPRKAANFSLEFIFQDVRERLKNRVNFKVVIVPFLSNGVAKRIKNVLYARRNIGPINHITGDVHYLAAVMPKERTVLTILDCVFMYVDNPLRRAVLKWFWLTMPIARVKYITAISEATKAEIIKYSSCSPDKIIVIPVAIAEDFTPKPKKFNAEKPVFLQIGTAPNKNLERTIRALEGIPGQLVIIGNVSDELLQLIRTLQIDFRNGRNLSQTEMLNEYYNCDVLLFASTLEGFGMPIVEANTVERVVVTSEISSMPEIAGNAACLVDPFSIESIRSGILRVIHDEVYREQLIEAGRKNRERFNPQRIAEQYLALYERMS